MLLHKLMSAPLRPPEFEAYRLLVQEIKDYAIYMIADDGTILTWNAGAERITGYKPQEVVGCHFSIFFPPEDAAQGKPTRLLGQALNDGRVEDEDWRVRKDGNRYWAHVVITRLRDERGNPRGFAAIIRDITQSRNTEAELRRAHDDLEKRVQERMAELQQANIQLEDANRMKDEFLATLSHELRTPLTAIVGWVQMLRADLLNDQQKEHALEVINRNLTTQTRLIDDLLNISRIVSGKLKIEPQVVHPAPIVREAIESVRLSITAKELKLETELDENAGPIRIDPERFQQIAWNLLSNAVKFTPKHGSIKVVMKRSGNNVIFMVKDTGEGITSDFLPYVFDRFRQADSSRGRRHGGLGLGLAIVRHLTELHGGAVAVDSRGPGHGSSFYVTLPLPGPQHPAKVQEAQPDAQTEPSLKGVRVLVLEDEPDTRDMVVQALQENGALVDGAGAASEALRLLEAGPHDVLISDLGMPGIDGYALLRSIRSTDCDFQNIPAVALTAYAREEDRLASFEAGFDAHIAKPVPLAELIRTVACLVNRQE